MKTIAFGEILWDKIEGQYHLGGTALNFAGHMAQLGSSSGLISRLGEDELGRRARDCLKDKGVDESAVGSSSRPTGTVDVTLERGLPAYIIHEKTAWDHIALSGEKYEELQKVSWDCFYFGTLAQRTEGNRALLKKLWQILPCRERFCDINIRQHYYSKTVVDESLKNTDIFKLNDEEQPLLSRLLYGEDLKPQKFFTRILEDYPLKLILFTQGKKGADCISTKDRLHQDCGQVSLADTVGAGDSFSAGFMYAYIRTQNSAVALAFAVKLADYVVSCRGGLPDYSPEIQKAAEALGHES